MRKWILIILFAAIALPAVAEDHRHKHDGEHHSEHHPAYVSEVLEEMLEGNGDTPIADITLEDAGSLLAELSIAVQKQAFVEKSRAASFLHPGAGQFMNGETGSGLLFLSAEILVSAGTLVGSYFLLPEDLQFGSIDYLNDSYVSIEAAWMDKSFMDLLPSMGVMAATRSFGSIPTKFTMARPFPLRTA